ncbi:MAG: UDP-N-acetylglucosamine--N-acetylmuramyl-(pentapeptide) pyrophosphoryl-undecaprenol N-acetylglucosamine transferase [Alphaproteobacteria bacterium]|nr:MAG: UDP-N-acetylglucosamine--N-acetylmuramyl-(pentapeptide) pyrophosphoryl-undecaprenol N-acetylglucosamine transferase [Alphaproteobacteria bacterium]
MSGKAKVLLAAGGTGGHMFPAGALAEQLKDADYEVHLATDKRGMAYVSNLTPMELHQIPAATPYGGGLMALPMRIITLVVSLLASIILVIRLRPKVIIGFGGYPSFGPIIAGLILRRLVLVHEQNAVMGRVNKLAANIGAYVATSFDDTANVPLGTARKLRRTGNPLRPAILKAAQGGYRYLASARAFELLVFGGSQGASVFADIVPQAIALLSAEQKRRLRIVHQVRQPEMRATLEAYGKEGIYSEIRDFFDDLPVRMRRAHLMIARGGASTVAEMTALGVPTIFVPLPGSLDQDQAHNVRKLAQRGGAMVINQKDLTAESLALEIEKLTDDETRLQQMSDKARKFAELDATGRLFRYVDCLAQKRPLQIDKPQELADG